MNKSKAKIPKEHLRHIMLYEFNRGLRAADTAKKIQETYGDDVINERSCRRWFARFKAGVFNLEDGPKSGRPTRLNSSELKNYIEQNPEMSTQELGRIFNVSRTTIHKRLKILQSPYKVRLAGSISACSDVYSYFLLK